MDVLPDLATRPMTVGRSRWLGRGLMAVAALVAAWWLRRLVRRPLISLLLAPALLPAVVLGLWAGFTLNVMDWDEPADFLGDEGSAA
ncbi:MAG: hypothetical protein C4558_04575 [Dehalococcoidia bacterium]|nr:MAG: hypothetical protein C4558_04575 [Dehalococcoidia bacterium]